MNSNRFKWLVAGLIFVLLLAVFFLVNLAVEQAAEIEHLHKELKEVRHTIELRHAYAEEGARISKELLDNVMQKLDSTQSAPEEGGKRKEK